MDEKCLFLWMKMSFLWMKIIYYMDDFMDKNCSGAGAAGGPGGGPGGAGSDRRM